MRSAAAVVALVLVAAACSSGDSDAGTTVRPVEPAPTTSPAASPEAVGAEDEPCPITIPTGALTPPEPYQPVRTDDELVWYGSAELWTALDSGGVRSPRKGVWWSARFPGGMEEEAPAISVAWHRLDESTNDITNDSAGTNAWTEEDGWFMIAGVDPDIDGCWEVTATYKGATLSYVYERS